MQVAHRKRTNFSIPKLFTIPNTLRSHSGRYTGVQTVECMEFSIGWDEYMPSGIIPDWDFGVGDFIFRVDSGYFYPLPCETLKMEGLGTILTFLLSSHPSHPP